MNFFLFQALFNLKRKNNSCSSPDLGSKNTKKKVNLNDRLGDTSLKNFFQKSLNIIISTPEQVTNSSNQLVQYLIYNDTATQIIFALYDQIKLFTPGSNITVRLLTPAFQSIKGIQISTNKQTIYVIYDTHVRIYNISCFSNQYQSNGTCINCSSTCLVCFNQTSWLTCIPNYQIINPVDFCTLISQNNTNTINSTNTTNTINTTSSTNATNTINNTTNPIHQTSIQNNQSQLNLNISNNLIQIFGLPTILKVSFQKQIFLAIDDFLIYNYHQTEYGPLVSQVFYVIQRIQNTK